MLLIFFTQYLSNIKWCPLVSCGFRFFFFYMFDVFLPKLSFRINPIFPNFHYLGLICQAVRIGDNFIVKHPDSFYTFSTYQLS